VSDSSDLPPGWANAAVGELLEDAKTGLVRSAKLQSDEREFPYIKMQNFDIDGEWHLDDVARVDASDDEVAKSSLQEGDVLFNTRNSTELVGKTAIWNGPEGTYLYNNNLLRMRFCPAMSQGWAAFHFRCPQFRKTLETIKSATTSVAAIYQKPLLQQNLRVPPLNEQRRIVAKIEELTARSRNAKQALDAIPPLLERFRQSVLAAAFRGDLTKQWRQQNPNTEPASELLKRIRQERRHRWEQDYLQTQKAKGKQPKNDKWKTKYKEPEPVDTSDLPELPVGWCWSSVDELADLQLGKMLDRKKRTKGTTMPYLRNQNVRWFDFDCTDMLEMPFEDHEVERYSIKLDDVVICEGGEPGRAAVWRGPETVMYQKALHRLRPYGDGSPEWFVFHLNHEAWTGRLRRSFTGTTIKHLTRTALLKRPVPVAPLAEQLVIVGLLGQAFSSARSILDCWSTAVARASQLDQSILAKAFRGELVPQDPSDEPAANLVQRVRADRAVAEPKKSRK